MEDHILWNMIAASVASLWDNQTWFSKWWMASFVCLAFTTFFCTHLCCVNDVNSTQPFLGNIRRNTSFSTYFHPLLRIHEILVGFTACLVSKLVDWWYNANPKFSFLFNCHCQPGEIQMLCKKMLGIKKATTFFVIWLPCL